MILEIVTSLVLFVIVIGMIMVAGLSVLANGSYIWRSIRKALREFFKDIR